LRLRSAPTDRLVAQLRLEQALNRVDWSAAGLLATSIVVVRRVAVHQHDSLAAENTALANTVSVAVRSAVESARRPWVDPSAYLANAIQFLDEAELVACLLRDWLRGAITERWWWRSILGDASPEHWLREHAIPRGEIVVAAMALLAAHNEAVHWCAKCGGADVERAVTAIAQAYGLNLDDASSEPAAAGSVPRVRK